MKAKIRDVGFSADILVAGVDIYLEPGEAGYETCFVDVPDHPATETEPNPPTHKVLVPVKSISISLPSNTTRKQAIDIIKPQLDAFKRAHSKLAVAQKWIGAEFQL